MARRAELLNAFPRGVLDPELKDRYDLAHYYLALETARNQIMLPQGGLRRRPGTAAARQRLRRRIEPVQITGAMITAPNGGTVDFLIDQDSVTVLTTSAVSGSPFIVAQIDLGAPVPIVFADLINFGCASLKRDDAIVVEWFDGSTWQPVAGSGDSALSPRKSIRSGTSRRTRRFGSAPSVVMTAQLWRIAIYGGSGLGAVSVGGFRLWRERAGLSPLQLLPFAKTAREAYEIALTDRNIDVFRSGAYYASVPVPAGADIIAEIKTEQSLDTLFLFHEDVDTQQVLRQGAHDEWNIAAPAFTNVPLLTESTSFSGDQDEIQDIAFSGLTIGASFVLFLGDAVTAPITYVDNPTLLTDIAAAIKTLPGINADDVITELRSSNPLTVRVSFINLNGNRRWPRLAGIPLFPSNAVIATTVQQRGLAAAGPLMGATTGWPRCGALDQSRLLLAGFRAAPSTYAFSRVKLLFDYQNTGSPVTADMAIINTLDSDEVETIQEVFLGQHLQIFTTRGEWWLEARTIDATQPLNAVLATRYGIAPEVPPIHVQGGTVFVQSGGDEGGVRLPNTVIRDMQFQFTETSNYTAEPLSLLAPHLLADVIGMAHRPGVTTREASLVVFLNRDGGFAFLTLLRQQEIIAMTSGDMQGAMRAVMADASRNLWTAVEREVGGAANLWLERFADAALLDAQVTVDFETPAAVVTGASHLEGFQVWAYADRDLVGPFTVAGGSFTLPKPASEVIYGLLAPIGGKTLPLREKLQNAQPFNPPARVYEVEWSVSQCGPFEMRANGGPWLQVPLRWFDGGPPPSEATGEEGVDVLDAPLLDRLYTGKVKVEGLEGWTRQGQIEWRQLVPAPFKLRSIRYQAAHR
jgi:hypothetical protein